MLFSSFIYLLIFTGILVVYAGKPVAVVQPIEANTRLALAQEGLDFLKGVSGPVVPVVVIGPYRSGKSFLLNQLIQVPCDEGFGVGHQRHTETKGIWVWNEPVKINENGQEINLLYFDTEGFESTGKSDAYDDRIFALSTFISGVLIYNLPETVRESDVEKLSFAVELADAFYGNKEQVSAGTMIWLIQRDFLQGSGVETAVREALSEVENPQGDKDIAQINRIRKSLNVLAKNSSAVGLPQPHIDRTKLCSMTDSDFEQGYVKGMQNLRNLVKKVAQPKTINNQVLGGNGLVDVIQSMVAALNERDIPNAGSIVLHFNQALLHDCAKIYHKNMNNLRLPLEEQVLSDKSTKYQNQAIQTFKTKVFGNINAEEGGRTLIDQLIQQIKQEYSNFVTANQLQSTNVCESIELQCEDVMEKLHGMKLPSVGKFQSEIDKCQQKFHLRCVGPAEQAWKERLGKAENREFSRFRSEYNEKLYNGLIVISLLLIVVFRFLIKISLLELSGWILFVVLEVYPKLFLTSKNLYETGSWKLLVVVWEAIIFNPLIDLEKYWMVVLILGIVGYFFILRWWRKWQILRRAKRKRNRPNEEREEGSNRGWVINIPCL